MMDLSKILEEAPIFSQNEIGQFISSKKETNKKEKGEQVKKVYVGKIRQHPNKNWRAKSFILVPNNGLCAREFAIEDVIKIDVLDASTGEVGAEIRPGATGFIHFKKDRKPYFNLIKHNRTIDILCSPGPPGPKGPSGPCCECCGWSVHLVYC